MNALKDSGTFIHLKGGKGGLWIFSKTNSEYWTPFKSGIATYLSLKAWWCIPQFERAVSTWWDSQRRAKRLSNLFGAHLMKHGLSTAKKQGLPSCLFWFGSPALHYLHQFWTLHIRRAMNPEWNSSTSVGRVGYLSSNSGLSMTWQNSMKLSQWISRVALAMVTALEILKIKRKWM